MRMFLAATLLGAVATAVAVGYSADASLGEASPGALVPWESASVVLDDDLTAVVRRNCSSCHNDALKTGNLSLSTFDVTDAAEHPELTERIVGKLRVEMMPPPGLPRPGGDTLAILATRLEEIVDEAAAARPNPGFRTFQRLNRSEYEAAIHDLLGMEVEAGRYLPQDVRSANFDNIADAQALSPAVMEAYLTAAAEISALAIGDPEGGQREVAYRKSGFHSQWERVEGAPYGTRGGISVLHNFPADGTYRFKMAFDHTTTGEMSGDVTRGEDIDISVDGERVALMAVDQFMNASDPNTVEMESPPVFVKAGPRRVVAAFIKLSSGPLPDLLSPHDWSIADRRIGGGGYGITSLTHLKELRIAGPQDVTGVSEHAIREGIFQCRPAVPSDEEPCAQRILTSIGERAFRRPLTETDVDDLMDFYREGASVGGFEVGVRTGLQAILASPAFVFRFEPLEEAVVPGGARRVSDLALASRLSFFMWGGPPDEELVSVAAEGRLSEPEVLEGEVRRMLAHPRGEAFATRFGAQWLRLHDLDNVNPDRLLFPDYHQELADAMRRETELLFEHILREDRSVLDLFQADYTFVNERLAKHYGIPDIVGEAFQRVAVNDENRWGILGHASILTLTSHAGRTSPVDRGKWIMSVLLNTPPPPPPPNVPALEETEGEAGGRLLTVREQLAMHRANPSCASCHNLIDPIGVALENFDVTGRWRIRDNGMPVDSKGQLWDGTSVDSPADLRTALLSRPDPLLRTFTMNLMAYALGRRVEYYDWPTIRSIIRDAEAADHRVSAYILGIVNSQAFQMQLDMTADGEGS